MADETDANLEALRAEYRELAGKKPGPKWDADTLAAKIAEVKANPPAPEVEGVRIVMTVDGVYLPLDADGNCFAWEGELNYDCVPVKRKTRLLVHPDMAKSLSLADKAEILD